MRIVRSTLTLQTIDALRDLVKLNHDAAIPDQPLEPDWDALARIRPWLWVAQEGAKAVGYCAHILTASHLFTGEKFSTCAAIYMLPAFRAYVPRMIAQIERELRQEGVQVINYSVPHMSRAGAFFEVIGYECTELVMTKRVHALPE